MPAISVPANLAFDSYDELVAGINDWLDRSDLTGVAQQMISLCESRLRRELVPAFAQTSASIITASTGLGALPSDFGTANRVISGRYTLPNIAGAGGVTVPTDYTTPYAYSIEQGQLRIWPAVIATVTLLYQPLLPQLTAASPTNTLLSKHPDLYFFGALMFANGYVANDARAGTFKALWDEALMEAKAYFTRQHFSGEMTPRVAFVP